MASGTLWLNASCLSLSDQLRGKPTIEHSSLAKWLKAEFGGTCLRKVLAIEKELSNGIFSFRCLKNLSANFRNRFCLGRRNYLSTMRFLLLPLDQASLALLLKKVCMSIGKILLVLLLLRRRIGSNCIAHFEGCFPSLQRVNMLQEISVRSRGSRIAGSFGNFPLSIAILQWFS